MPVQSVRNQYPGVNAHLHSCWQGAGGWSRFHTNHITDLMRALRPLLLPMGYDANVEPSVQIRRLDDSDLQSAKNLRAIAIYRITPNRIDRGDPVAWIELPSPSNKPGGRDAKTYFDKRLALLEGGMVFVELDCLHESPSTLRGIPGYRTQGNGDETARAYRLIVIDPRPDIERGVVRVKEFDVDAPIPVMTIPLSRQDALDFDFNAPYQKTIEETLYGLRLADYSQLPLHFERYSRADQTRIARRMVAVLDAARAGRDLESAPFAVEVLGLEAAMGRMERARE